MKLSHVLTFAILAGAIASPAGAQDTARAPMASASIKTGKTRKAKKESLKAEAKISRDSAKVIALSKVAAGSKVRKSKLERENGIVVYSFDVKVPNQAGVEEINVNAIDGTVVSQTHETAKQEKAEGKKEKKEKKKADDKK